MVNPQFIEQKPLSIGEVRDIVAAVETRDKQLNFLSNKTKEYLEMYSDLSKNQRDELTKKLSGLNVTRLREDVIAKILDFLPQTVTDLKVLLVGYNITLSKKDQDGILEVLTNFKV